MQTTFARVISRLLIVVVLLMELATGREAALPLMITDLLRRGF
jgi:hypothetical protein